MQCKIYKKGLVFGMIILFVSSGFLSSINAGAYSVDIEKKIKAMEKTVEINANMDAIPIGFRTFEFFCGRITNVTKENNNISFEAVRLFYLIYFRLFLSDIGLFMTLTRSLTFSYDDDFRFIGILTDNFICGFMLIRWWKLI